MTVSTYTITGNISQYCVTLQYHVCSGSDSLSQHSIIIQAYSCLSQPYIWRTVRKYDSWGGDVLYNSPCCRNVRRAYRTYRVFSDKEGE